MARSHFSTPGSRLGTQPAVPVTLGLGDPVLLYDSRDIASIADPVPNQGTAGSAFDMVSTAGTPDVGEVASIGGRFPSTFPVSPLSWDLLGGDACDAPLTWMVAYGTTSPGVLVPTTSCLAQFEFNDEAMVLQAEARRTSSTPLTPDVLYGGNYINGDIARDPDTSGFDFSCTLVTTTWDPRTSQGYGWMGTTPVIPVDNNGFPAVLGRGGNTPCLLADWGDQIDNLDGGFAGISAATRHPGTAFQGIVGVALFRGMPLEGELQAWVDYWYPPGLMFQGDAALVDITRTGTTTPHSYVFEVPEDAGPYMSMIVFPAGGHKDGNLGSASAYGMALLIDAGDEIEFQLGGMGSDWTTGAGGWPDGGQGGLNIGNGFYGGGGGGSTKIYKNGVLVAHLGGGGGHSNWPDSFSGVRKGAGEFGNAGGEPGVPGVNAHGNGIGAGEGRPSFSSSFGNGFAATISAAGAASGALSHSGSAGSGSTGGTGGSHDAFVDGTVSGGGGGGGGYFGGGGGGMNIEGSPGSDIAQIPGGFGGGGSSWYDSSVITLTDAASGIGGLPSANARIQMRYDPPPQAFPCLD